MVTDDRGTDDPDDDRAHCLEACTIGEPPEETCQSDERVACATLDSIDDPRGGMRMASPGGASDNVCRPLCMTNSDCSPDRCNLRTGACEPEGLCGDPFGAECDPYAEEPSCAGFCVEVEGAAYCSQRCWCGSVDNCGDLSADGSAGPCHFPEVPEGRIGDVGFCAVLCVTDDDCTHPELTCQPFESSSTAAIVGRAGVCAPE